MCVNTCVNVYSRQFLPYTVLLSSATSVLFFSFRFSFPLTIFPTLVLIFPKEATQEESVEK